MVDAKNKKPFILGEKQKAAVKMFWLGGYKIQDVASALGVHRSTLWRWYQHEEMRRYHDWYIRQQMGIMRWKMQDKAEKKAQEIREKLRNGNPVEVNALANDVLDGKIFGVSLMSWLKD